MSDIFLGQVTPHSFSDRSAFFASFTATAAFFGDTSGLPENTRMTGAPSRNACDVFSRALPSPMSNHTPSESLDRNRPGGVWLRTASTIRRAINGFSRLGQLTYDTLTSLTSSLKLSLPGWLLEPPPRPHTAV